MGKISLQYRKSLQMAFAIMWIFLFGERNFKWRLPLVETPAPIATPEMLR